MSQLVLGQARLQLPELYYSFFVSLHLLLGAKGKATIFASAKFKNSDRQNWFTFVMGFNLFSLVAEPPPCEVDEFECDPYHCIPMKWR